MKAEQASLEAKNHELVEAFKEKTKSQQQTQKLYQSLKAQVMASHVAHAAGDEAEFTLQTARGDRFIDRLPGARTGTANYSQMGHSQQTGGGRRHHRENSRSSGSSGRQQQQQGGGIHLGPPFNHSILHGRGLGGRVNTGRKSTLYLLSGCIMRCWHFRAMQADNAKNQLLLAHRPIEAVSQSWAEHVRTRI
jgi:hypothetical protein